MGFGLYGGQAPAVAPATHTNFYTAINPVNPSLVATATPALVAMNAAAPAAVNPLVQVCRKMPAACHRRFWEV